MSTTPKLPEGWQEAEPKKIGRYIPEPGERFFQGQGASQMHVQPNGVNSSYGASEEERQAILAYCRETSRPRTLEELRARLRELGSSSLRVDYDLRIGSAKAEVVDEHVGGEWHITAKTGWLATEHAALAALVATLEAKVLT